MPASEAAAISALGKLVAVTLPMLESKIEEVLKKRAGLKDHVGGLKFHLHAIQSIIVQNRKIIRSQSSTSQQLRDWTVLLRCFAYDMEDYIEGYHANTITGVKLYDKITELKQSVEDLIGLWKELLTMQKELNPISDEGYASSSSSRPTTSNPQRQHDPGLPLADLMREEHIGTLLGLADKKLKIIVISVIGFGGTGKTNLCQQVYNKLVLGHNNGRDQFSRHAFVSAAGKDKDGVLGEIILKFLELESKEEGYDGNANAITRFIHNYFGSHTNLRIIQRFFNRQQVAQDGNEGIENDSIDNVDHQVRQFMSELDERLRDKRYCIGVDDVGSEELGKLITCFFPENNMGSRIIVGMAVVGSSADSGNGQDIVSLNQFRNATDDEGRRHRFKVLDSSSSSPSLLVLISCDDGLPLPLVSISEVVGGPFNSDNVDEAWRQYRTEGAALLRQNMHRVLPHGYDCLQHIHDVNHVDQYIPDLQACLLYFAMFPCGNDVKRGSLIRRWLAEGLELGSSSIDEAAKRLQALIDRNFVWPQHVSMSQGQHVKACQPPEEVIPFITKKSIEEDFIMVSCDGEHITLNSIRRLSLHPTPVRSGARIKPMSVDDLPERLRTLAVSRVTSVDRIIKCKRLRVLDLEEYIGLQAIELDLICNNLNLLKYLSLQAGNIKKVPSSISNLQCLETLDLGDDKKDPVKVPIEVIKLPRLKHLLGKFKLESKWNGIPNRFLPVHQKGEDSNLERLAGFVTSKGEGFPPRMCRMKKLWKVKIWFKSDADAKSLKSHLPDAITNFLRDNNIDRTLSLCFDDGCPSPGNLLDSLAKVSGRLYSLKLCGKNLSKIPINFVAKLTGITKLCLSCWVKIKLDATFLDELSSMNDLKYLKLQAVTIEGVHADNPRAGNNQEEEKVVIKTTHIKNVERMHLVAKSRLPEIEIKPRALEKLVSLHLISEDTNCPSPSANVICKARDQDPTPLPKIKEVELNAKVAPQTLKDWQKAARHHHNCPRILLMEHPRPFKQASRFSFVEES